MEPWQLQRLAQLEVDRCLRGMPVALRKEIEACAIHLESMDALDPDSLGRFEGLPFGLEPGLPAELPQIQIFIGALWLWSNRQRGEFRRQVRVTLLHELGHFLGWDEGQVAALGLE